MKKFLTLLFGLIIASLAVYAIPKDLEKVKLKDVIKIEISHDAPAIVMDQKIQIDVDDGVLENDMVFKASITELETEYIVQNEGVPMAGHRRWFSPGQHSIENPQMTNSAARAKGELNLPPLIKTQTPLRAI